MKSATSAVSSASIFAASALPSRMRADIARGILGFCWSQGESGWERRRSERETEGRRDGINSLRLSVTPSLGLARYAARRSTADRAAVTDSAAETRQLRRAQSLMSLRKV